MLRSKTVELGCISPSTDGQKYQRTSTYCKRFHLLHSKHGTGEKERKESIVSV